MQLKPHKNNFGPVKTENNINKFRGIMCTAYSAAGILHLIDFAGPSNILLLAGAPRFEYLPPIAQGIAIVWSILGPLCYLARPRPDGSIDTRLTDGALILYGGFEVAVAFGAYIFFESHKIDAVLNAVAVQLVVGICYTILSRRS